MVDELDRQIADLSARLSATTAEKLRYKAERDALVEIVGKQQAELQQHQQHRGDRAPNIVRRTAFAVNCQQHTTSKRPRCSKRIAESDATECHANVWLSIMNIEVFYVLRAFRATADAVETSAGSH